ITCCRAMPIEFRCSQCQKLLRTPDDTAGKQAKCPSCGAVVPIPETSQATDADLGATQAYGGSSYAVEAPAPPSGGPNPYASPLGSLGPAPMAREEARGRVNGPAIGLM